MVTLKEEDRIAVLLAMMFALRATMHRETEEDLIQFRIGGDVIARVAVVLGVRQIKPGEGFGSYAAELLNAVLTAPRYPGTLSEEFGIAPVLVGG